MLQFVGCGGNRIHLVDQLVIEHTIFQSIVGDDSALILSEVVNASIEGCVFNASRFESHADEMNSTINMEQGFCSLQLQPKPSEKTGGAIVITHSYYYGVQLSIVCIVHLLAIMSDRNKHADMTVNQNFNVNDHRKVQNLI